MRFIKIQADGNDFIVARRNDFSGYDARELCDRHYGIGADGVLLWEKNDEYWMDIVNADGSESDICVNGLRGLGLWLMEKDRIECVYIRTRSGLSRVERSEDRVDAIVELKVGEMRDYGFEGLPRVYYYRINNEHALTFYDFDEENFYKYAGKIERELGANVSFVKRRGDRYYAKVWERGVGHTLSCGSAGICIFYHLERKEGLTDVEIEMDGGLFIIKRDGKGVRISGKASIVFCGEV